MKTYSIEFIGRLKNAIGVTYRIYETLAAVNYDDAILKLYDRYEHIRVLNFSINEE